MQDVLPTTAQRYNVAVSKFEEYSRVRDIHGLEDLVKHGLNDLGHACMQIFEPVFASESLGPGQAGTLHWLEVLRAPLQDHQKMFRTFRRAKLVSRHHGGVQNTSVSRFLNFLGALKNSSQWTGSN